MINKDSAHQQHMYHCDLSIFMINKDGSLLDKHMSHYGSPQVVSNTRTKSKMAEKTPEHTGREQKS